MLYVFQVDTGVMMTFEMNLALESVINLKEAISLRCRIPIDRQVLLVSGGECLEPYTRVCNYSAGTDTNPIFLFNKNQIESTTTSSTAAGQQLPTNQLHYGSNENLSELENLKEQVDGCLSLPPTYMTVVSRCQLAQQLHEMGRDQLRRCESLIHDQHLQHQGWAAVVANLEDIITAFNNRIIHFQLTYGAHLETKNNHYSLLDSFSEDLEKLREIKITACLLRSTPEDELAESISLFQWIEDKDRSNPLEHYALNFKKQLNSLDPAAIESLEREAKAVVEKGGQSSMKEIKGLEERLCGLNQLLTEASKLVQEQHELVQGFVQNQSRVSDLKDTSILPDLCTSHKHQLLVMQKNHAQLDNIRRRCSKAKEELSSNLNSRLKWVMYVQKSLLECSNRLTMYVEKLRRLSLQFRVVEQMHSAPRLYAAALHEVLRRQKFTHSFLQKASEISEKMDFIYKREMEKRKEFASEFDDHFLTELFQGLDEYPKPFANTKPEEFDTRLPPITSEDVTLIRSLFPSLPSPQDSSASDFDFSSSKSSEEGDSASVLQLENATLREENQSLVSNLASTMCLLDSLSASSAAALKEAAERTEREREEMRAQMTGKEEELRRVGSELEEERSGRERLRAEVEEVRKEMREEMEKERRRREEEILMIEKRHEEELERCREEKENELREMREKSRSDFEGLKSRYKLMNSMSLEQQKSPVVEHRTRNFSSSEEPVSREREISSGSLPEDDEGNNSFSKSVYGLDTSAVDAASTLAICSSIEGSGRDKYPEFLELITPSKQIMKLASDLVQNGKITIKSCSSKTEDKLLIYWDERVSSYLIYLDMNRVHFLHTECLKALKSLSDKHVDCFIGVCTYKESCIAKREKNRYNVPLNFEFSRVKTTEKLRAKLLQSFLNDTWDEISDEFVSSTPKDSLTHLTPEEQCKFSEAEKAELRKRDELLVKYNDEILTKQVANLREQLRNGQAELEELRVRYGRP